VETGGAFIEMDLKESHSHFQYNYWATVPACPFPVAARTHGTKTTSHKIIDI
jgi:hypothetical protein